MRRGRREEEDEEDFFSLHIFTFYNCIVPMGFLTWEIRVAFPGESVALPQPTVHLGCFNVFIIHRTLICTT